MGKIEGKNLPEKLKSKLVKPPITRLWYRGEWQQNISTRSAAIIGSRKMSRYGRQVIEEIVPRLVGAGFTIVSGLMYGVDQLAHRVCLECGGKAIAVLGYGITNDNEPQASQLREEIVESGGLVISEYEGDQVSQRWMYPQRNRIVVAMSELVVVVEAGIKSGSLGTAKLAKKQGKKIYAVPGNIFSEVSEGTNELIRLGEAMPLTRNELVSMVGESITRGQQQSVLSLMANEREVYQRLEIGGPKSCNELARSMGLATREIAAILTQMELKNLVSEERGIWRIN